METSALKQSISEKLQKREDERHYNRETKKAEKSKQLISDETIVSFKQKFDELNKKLETKLESIDSLNVVEKSITLDSLSIDDVSAMQKLITDSTSFLSAFSLKTAQKSMNDAKKKIADKKIEALPKKKFEFKSNKKREVTTAETQVRIDDANKIIDKPAQHKFILDDDLFPSQRIENLSDSEISKTCESTNSNDFILSNLTNCVVQIQGNPKAVNIFKLNSCKIFLGPVSGSILIENCNDCIFVAASQQMRIHSTFNTQFYIHVTSRAIIEECNGVSFAPYNWKYDSLDEDYRKSGLDKKINNWSVVEDFNWLVPNVMSPNWSIIGVNDRLISWK